jgi:hypothetical protein
MKRILLAASAIALSASVAHADPYANLYGNTLTITAADGSKSTVLINQDGSWQQQFANGTVLKGTYAWKDTATACFTIVTPPPKDPNAPPFCPGNQTAHAVGDTWTMNGADGKSTSLTITAGR